MLSVESESRTPKAKSLRMDNEPTLESLQTILLEVQRNTSQLLSDNAVLRNEVDDLKKSVEFQSDLVEELRTENLELKAQVQELTTNQEQIIRRADDLEERHDNLEIYKRKYNLEIHGNPEEDEEDLEEIVIKLGEAVGVEIEEDDIDIVHRLKVKVKKGPRPIIVHFMSHKMKSELYKAKKKLRGIAGFNDDLKAAKQIYINENVTTAKRRSKQIEQLLVIERKALRVQRKGGQTIKDNIKVHTLNLKNYCKLIIELIAFLYSKCESSFFFPYYLSYQVLLFNLSIY